MRELVISGNELVALAAIDAGCRFFGGYPITPSSEIAHTMSALLPKHNGTFIQMEDEISGICVALGASMSGKKAMTASSGPGISLKAEQIGFAFMAEIPLVIVDVMRGGPSTGLPTRVSQGDIEFLKHPTHGDFKAVMVAPSNLEEIYFQTIKAFNLAEELMTPVFLVLDETIGHMYGKVVLPEVSEIEILHRKRFSGDPKEYLPYDVPQNSPAVLNPFFEGYFYHVTGLHHGKGGFPTEDRNLAQNLVERLCGKIESRAEEIAHFQTYMLEDAEYVLIVYGSVCLAAIEAMHILRSEGKKVGILSPKILYPLAPQALKQHIKENQKVCVIELNRGQYVFEVEQMLGHKVDFIGQYDGRPIDPDVMVREIMQRIQGGNNGF
ncbi:2-oxoglutarate synthase subunit alpha [Helicobacter kayseriensis]|uniref:2-oxoglutarate synthase subunit alpha n=1 Tax=Helicobacter kayseriensis TaxID=2905877 RepID=UPI001E5411C5|nr:2-oxoglutarate synthase subunit alpha [Helicobacter kayseriensis]MCE3047433.1 2-oxoglutarate synthase subunit alpha [Helicobacter kayseriensis]MCE3048896.1 2-oxoglutarate synthase subunit alpha [Helicobacter kayseriensis]